MRQDGAAFSAKNLLQSKAPQFLIKLDFGANDFYLTGGSSTALPGGVPGADVKHGSFKTVSSTSQSIDPKRARSTIGAITFEGVDLDQALTAEIRTRLTAGEGLRGKTVTFYLGHDDLDFTDFITFQTQVIRRVVLRGGVTYVFHCEDIQREARKDILTEVSTTLGADLTAAATTMTVDATSDFTLVAHGTSYTDAPSATVGYLEVKQSDRREVIRYTGSTATTFTGLTRGVLNTAAQAFTFESGGSDNGIKVKQYVYLEMPVFKLAYAILTGDLIGQGATLPDEWHLGVDTGFVNQTGFTQFDDIYDSSDDTAGIVARFEGIDRQSGKDFIERELMLMVGAFMYVQNDGKLTVKRNPDVQPTSGYVAILDTSNIVKHGDLSHAMEQVTNEFEIQWNFNVAKKEFTRKNLLIDSDSQSIHGGAKPIVLPFRGLSGTRHSSSLLETTFNTLRDRYSGPPILMTVTCLPSLNVLEVADPVRVVLPIEDFAGASTLDRTFEIQRSRINWVTGTVTLDLFASSQRATLQAPDPTSQIANAWYSVAGTEINAANFPGNVSSAGGLTTISGGITLSGNADMNNAGAIYYVDEACTVGAGVTVTITGNVQLRVKGHLTVDGTIDGIENSGDTSLVGYVGSANMPQAGIEIDTSTGKLFGTFNPAGGPFEPVMRFPLHATIPYLNVEQDVNGVTSGFPSDLRGTAGQNGSAVMDQVPVERATGGTPGDGGSGLVIVSRGGSFGGSGSIDLSGGNGAAGGTWVTGGKTLHAGAGASGGPGACYWILDGRAVTAPTLNANFTGKYGSVDLNSSDPSMWAEVALGDISSGVSAQQGLPYTWVDGVISDVAQVDISVSAQRLQRTFGFVAAAEDVDEGEALGLGADWPNISDSAGTRPDDNADVTSANTAADTVLVNGVAAGTISAAQINFDGRNDRSATAITVPTIAGDGTAIDHVVNTDSTVDISFEWLWGGTEADIDGFIVYLRSSKTDSASYNFGTSPAQELSIVTTADRRAFAFTGVPVNNYYTFGIQAFRIVDADVAGAPIISSVIVQPALGAEDPYQPSTTIAFAGDLTGTIGGSAAGALANLSSVDLSTGEVTNKTGANIVYTVGSVTLDSLKPAAVGADVTGSNTAADTTLVSGTASATVETGAALGTTSSQATGVADNANVTAPGLGARKNKINFTTTNNGEFYVHGFDADGVAADVDGFIQYDGTNKTVTKGAIYTNGATSGWVMFETAGGGPFTHGGSQSDIALAFKVGSQWKYDKNGPATNFSTTATMIIIGTVDVASTDLLNAVTIWSSGMAPSSIGALTDIDVVTLGTNVEDESNNALGDTEVLNINLASGTTETLLSADTSRNQSDPTFAVKKSFAVPRYGSITLAFRVMRDAGTPDGAQAQYKVTQGATEHVAATNITETSFTAKSASFTLANLTDTVDIELKGGIQLPATALLAYVDNARVKATQHVELTVVTN